MSAKECNGVQIPSVIQAVKMKQGYIIPLAFLWLVTGVTVITSAITINKCCKIGESFEDFTLKNCASRTKKIQKSDWPVFMREDDSNTFQFLTNPELMHVNLSETSAELQYDPDKVHFTSHIMKNQ